MAGIFVSYRREDGRADAGRLTKDLKEHLEGGQIFRDIDTLQPGTDFVKAINTAIGSCSALLAIIGPNWLSSKGQDGRRRIDDPTDFVRLEIEAALSRDIRVIPLLVGEAKMPRQTDLPDSLMPLARRHAHELSESRWDFDVERLVATLAEIPGVKQRKPAHEDPSSRDRTETALKRMGIFAGAAALSAMGVVFLLAGLIEGQGIAFVFAAGFLGGAYWLFGRSRKGN